MIETRKKFFNALGTQIENEQETNTFPAGYVEFEMHSQTVVLFGELPDLSLLKVVEREFNLANTAAVLMHISGCYLGTVEQVRKQAHVLERVVYSLPPSHEMQFTYQKANGEQSSAVVTPFEYVHQQLSRQRLVSVNCGNRTLWTEKGDWEPDVLPGLVNELVCLIDQRAMLQEEARGSFEAGSAFDVANALVSDCLFGVQLISRLTLALDVVVRNCGDIIRVSVSRAISQGDEFDVFLNTGQRITLEWDTDLVTTLSNRQSLSQ